MARFSQWLVSGEFASGVIYYQDSYPGQEQSARIVFPIVVAQTVPLLTIIDTGAPWCILDPTMMSDLGLIREENYLSETTIVIRGIYYQGRLQRTDITLPADEGENLDIEATVFVPRLAPDESWVHPNFIGLDGLLNRIRFAVDPAENAFYFGPLG